MIRTAVEDRGLDKLEFLFIENVGNLACPSSCDPGENLRVVLLSVTEGGDKPLKYPTIFKARAAPNAATQGFGKKWRWHGPAA